MELLNVVVLRDFLLLCLRHRSCLSGVDRYHGAGLFTAIRHRVSHSYQVPDTTRPESAAGAERAQGHKQRTRGVVASATYWTAQVEDVARDRACHGVPSCRGLRMSAGVGPLR